MADKKNDPITPFLSKHIPAANDKRLMRDNYHRYCYRHNPDIKCNKEADQRRMDEIQRTIDKLPNRDQEVISNIWSVFSAAPADQRVLILKGLLSQCCFPQLSFISSEVKELIKIDFIHALPVELSLKILCYLDCASLCNAAQVSKTWKRLADDDRVWHHLCEQHIDRKCPNCGWGLPLMHMKRAREYIGNSVSTSRPLAINNHINSQNNVQTPQMATTIQSRAPSTRSTGQSATPSVTPAPSMSKLPIHSLLDSSCASKRSIEQVEASQNSAAPEAPPAKTRKTRPWKSVYSERFKVERNWRKGIFKLKEFKGHTDGILCLQYNHKYLFTGSYDCTAKVWDIRTGNVLKTLIGHTRGVRTIVFDDKKAITGSLDSTIKIWNYKTGQCISTYRGHSDAVICVDVHGKTIVSGSADKTIKVWNVETRTCHSLRGHTDWVNCVKIHAPSNTVISSSDDCTIRLWSLTTNNCLRIFNGKNCHIGQVQCVVPLTVKGVLSEDPAAEKGDEIINGDPQSVGNSSERSSNHNNNNNDNNNNENSNLLPSSGLSATSNTAPSAGSTTNRSTPDDLENFPSGDEMQNETDQLLSGPNYPTHILSAGLDNQIKVWGVKTGKCIRTQFGHIEGVWSIAADNFRIVSGAHDKLVKVWDLQSGKCIHTFGGHNAAISSIGLSDSRFAAGDDSGNVKMYCFDDLDEGEYFVKGNKRS